MEVVGELLQQSVNLRFDFLFNPAPVFCPLSNLFLVEPYVVSNLQMSRMGTYHYTTKYEFSQHY